MAVVEQVVIMAMLCAVGVLCRKLKIITADTTKHLTSLAINIALPAVIIMSYQKPFNAEMLEGLLISFFLAIVSFAISLVLIPLIVRNKDKSAQAVERFSAIYSNCSFMGIPLIQGIYGEEGVFLQTAYITVFNLLSWTHGYIMMKGEKAGIKEVAKSLLSPCVISTVVGIALFLCNISFPSFIGSFLRHLGNLNTPMAMIIAGSTISEVNFIKALKKPRLYYVCFLKLIVLPAILMGICLLLKFDSMISGVSIMVCACPSAALCTMLALRFNKNAGYSTEIFAVSTVLSVLSLPLILSVFERLVGV